MTAGNLGSSAAARCQHSATRKSRPHLCHLRACRERPLDILCSYRRDIPHVPLVLQKAVEFVLVLRLR